MLGKHAVSNLMQQNNPVYSIEIWIVASLKVGAGKGAEKNWLRKGIHKSGALSVSRVCGLG